MDYFLKNAKWFVPLTLFALFTPFSAPLDRQIAHFFYQQGLPDHPFVQNGVIQAIYSWGVIPGQLLAAAALILFFLSFFFVKLFPLKRPALFVMLTLAIGSGLITHAILKDHWGRPRPRQVEEFGGTESFRPCYEPHFSKKSAGLKSFPCGHSTMGFFFFTCIILGTKYQRKWLLWSGIALTAVLSLLLSYARIAAGGHFFSDVVFAGLIMWLTAIWLEKVVLKDSP